MTRPGPFRDEDFDGFLDTVLRDPDAATAPGLPSSLLGCFPGDPESDLAGAPWGSPHYDLPQEVFAPNPEPTAPAAVAPEAVGPAVAKGKRVEPGLPAIGSVIDKYRVEELVGTGGFAAVYRATHLLLRVPVAIKLLKPSVVRAHPHMTELLCEEARFAARVSHPNVVRVLDVTHTRQITYIVMEFIEGESLHALIRKGVLHPLRVIGIGLDVCLGLKGALAQGLIHRDIKPANILIGRDGSAKIVDLGLAQHARDEPGRERGGSGKMVVGTPAYMSPEQALDPERVDFRSDIYSLGVTLYHAAVGSPPFQAADPLELISLHKSVPVRPPGELVAEFPFEQTRILMWMLEKDPGARPTYEQLQPGLEEALQAITIEDGIKDLFQ
jgi:serine/threonine protein kinase